MYTESAESVRDRQVLARERDQQARERRANRGYINSFTGEVQDFDVPPVRDQGFEMRADHPGHYGSHRGQGTPDCPTELHHHHDFRCGSIPPEALRRAQEWPSPQEMSQEMSLVDLERLRERIRRELQGSPSLLLPMSGLSAESFTPDAPKRPRVKKQPKTEPSTTVEGTAPLVQRRRARPNG